MQRVDILQASRALDDVARQYRATGLPWTSNQLIQPPVPPEQNAAPLMRSVLKAADWDKFSPVSTKISDALDSGDLNRASDLLEHYSKALSFVTSAVALPRLDYHRDWDMGTFLLFPEMAQSKSVAKALVYRARLEAARRQPALAAKDLLTARKLGSLVGQEPDLISILVQIALEAIADKGGQRCAASCHEDPAALKQIETALETPVRQPDFAYSMRGEAFLQVTTCRNLDLIGGLAAVEAMNGGDADGAPVHVDLSKLRRNGYPSGLASRAFMTGMLRCWIQMAPVLNDPKAGPIEIGKRTQAIADNVSKDFKASNVLAQIIFPVFRQAGVAVVRSQATDRTSQALAKALELRATTGRYPASISDLPGQWIDPFGGKPLRLKLMRGGIRIYSLGPDLKDEHGLVQSELSAADLSYGQHDVVAAYPPVLPSPTKSKAAPIRNTG